MHCGVWRTHTANARTERMKFIIRNLSAVTGGINKDFQKALENSSDTNFFFLSQLALEGVEMFHFTRSSFHSSWIRRKKRDRLLNHHKISGFSKRLKCHNSLHFINKNEYEKCFWFALIRCWFFFCFSFEYVTFFIWLNADS